MRSIVYLTFYQVMRALEVRITTLQSKIVLQNVSYKVMVPRNSTDYCILLSRRELSRLKHHPGVKLY